MIEIKCTEAEKEQLTIVLSSGGQCPFAMSDDMEHQCKTICYKCITDNIKWKTEGDGEQEAQRDYEQSVEYAQYCERNEPTYNPEDGSM